MESIACVDDLDSAKIYSSNVDQELRHASGSYLRFVNTGVLASIRNDRSIYNSGQVSAFAFGGTQLGWNGAAQASINDGFVWGLNDENTNYSDGFTGANGGFTFGGFLAASSGGLTGSARELIPNSPEVKVAGTSFGASLLPTATGGITVTNYSKPLQLGKGPFGLGDRLTVDTALYLARQGLCK